MNGRRQGTRHGSRGFTMVELVLVIILLGILAATVAPRFDVAGYESRVRAQELVAAIRHAQERAMSHSGGGPFRIEIGSGGFRVTDDGDDIPDPAEPSKGEYTSDDDAWAGVSVSPTGTIAFDGRGTPQCSGGFSPCEEPDDSNLTITLSTGGVSTTIEMERVTGYARIP